MFCPKCGSILKPKKSGSKRVLACSCGYTDEKIENAIIRDKLKKEAEIEVVDPDDINTLPLTDADCPKCGHTQARYWTLQTRAGDEPETKFLKCTKCNHTWRDYS